MNESVLYNLARLVLPSEVLDYFDVTGVDSGDTEMHIHFTSPTSITDFPIRDHKVILEVRLRRWLDLRTGKSFSLPMKLATDGTRYSKEFAAFLKETYGHIPSDLPYA